MAEIVTIEHNGEIFDVEVPDGTPDSKVLEYVKQQQGGGQISGPGPQPAENIAGQAAIAAAPGATKLALGAGQALLNAPVTALTAPITSPLSTARNVAGAIERLVPQVPIQTPGPAGSPIVSMPGTRAMNVGELLKAGARGVGGALVAPESAFLMPYNMAAYEQAKIRANPTAPGLEYNPYAQTVRGEAATQGRAGAANQMRAVANMPFGGVTPQERAMLEQDQQMRTAIRKKAFDKVMGPVAPGSF
jgi:hypothetical protein